MNSLTLTGQNACLIGGGLANVAVTLRLYASASSPSKNGTGFIEIPAGNGYSTGGKTIAAGNWTAETVSNNRRIRLADQSWIAAGGSIVNIAGAFLCDAGGNALAWFELPQVTTILNGDTLILDDLNVGLV